MGEVVAGIETPDGEPGAVRDAAVTLRQSAGGFEMVGGAVARAGAAVGIWDGVAAFMFRMSSGALIVSAKSAGPACEMAAAALEHFADELADARSDIANMQEVGRELERQKAIALEEAEAATGRMLQAMAAMPAAGVGAIADGGQAATRVGNEIEQAAGEAEQYRQKAEVAGGELEKLQTKARRRIDELEQSGDAASARVRAAHGDLPEVDGSRAGSAGNVPLTSHTERTSVALTVVVVRVGENEAIVKEHLANGKWRVTMIKGFEGGFEFDPVPGVAIDAGGKGGAPPGSAADKAGRLGASPDVQAAFLMQHEDGEVFEFSSESEADRFIEYRDQDLELGAEDTPGYGTLPGVAPVPLTAAQKANIKWADRQEPVETYSQDGSSADFGVNAGGVGGGGSLVEGLGLKTDTETGATTRYAKLAGELAGDFAPPGVQAGGQLNGEAIVGVTRTSEGDVSGMTINLSGTAQGYGGLGMEAPLDDLGKSQASHHELAGTRVERVIHIDATDPGNQEAIERFVDSGGADPGAVIDIVERLDDDVRVDIRHFDTEGSTTGASIDTKIVKIDGENEVIDSRLDSASHRTPGGDEYVRTR